MITQKKTFFLNIINYGVVSIITEKTRAARERERNDKLTTRLSEKKGVINKEGGNVRLNFSRHTFRPNQRVFKLLCIS